MFKKKNERKIVRFHIMCGDEYKVILYQMTHECGNGLKDITLSTPE